MEENKVFADERHEERKGEEKKGKFEFILTVNGLIVSCKDFDIEGYNKDVENTQEIVEMLDECAEVINNELKNKTSVYLHELAPMVFENRDEMKKYVSDPVNAYRMKVPSFVVFREEDGAFVWDGADIEPYWRPFPRNEFVRDPKFEQKPCTLKIKFMCNGKTIASKIWDGGVYPKFVRSLIDLSNTRNYYKEKEIFAPAEYYVTEQYNRDNGDITDSIVDVIRRYCTVDSDELTTGWYEDGKLKYPYDIYKENKKFFAYWKRKENK